MALLGDTSRDKVQGAVNEQDGALNLSLKSPDKDDKRKGEEAITITDTSCKP